MVAPLASKQVALCVSPVLLLYWVLRCTLLPVVAWVALLLRLASTVPSALQVALPVDCRLPRALLADSVP